MSIQTEIDRIAGNVTAALAACADKGADVPTGSTSDDLAAIIAAIEAGGGGGLTLDWCQTVLAGEFVPSENITSDYIIETDMTYGDIANEWNYLALCIFLFDRTTTSDTAEFNGGIMALYTANITKSAATSRGYRRTSSGSYSSLTSGGAVGQFCNESGDSVFSDSKYICFRVSATASAMLLAGHAYQYIIFVRA